MGTLSKRRLEDFGHDVKDRIEGIRASVGKKLDAASNSALPLETSKPSNVWVALAGLTFVGSLGLRFIGRSRAAGVLGSWVPTLLLLGLYDRLGSIAAGQHHGDRLDVH